jgi:hypothetical protein
MHVAACCLALFALGQSPPPPASAGDSDIAYQLNVYEMQGLQWRGTLQSQLKAIDHQDGATVWVLPRKALGKLTEAKAAAVFTPRPSSSHDVPAEVQTSLFRSYVSGVERVADGPVGKATALAFAPQVERAEEWLNVAVKCARGSGGVEVSADIDEGRLAAMHSYAVSETVAKGLKHPELTDADRTVTVQVQVPEIVRGGVQGKWTVPNGHVLVVGLGVHQTDIGGKTVVAERVAVIDPFEAPAAAPAVRQASMMPIRDNTKPTPLVRPVTWEHPLPAPFNPVALPAPAYNMTGAPSVLVNSPNTTVVVVVAGQPGAQSAVPQVMTLAPAAATLPIAQPVPIAASPLPMNMPPVPQNMLPTPRNAAGEVVPLPPLPKAEEIEIDPDNPRGTPQTPHVKPESAEPAKPADTLPEAMNLSIIEGISDAVLTYAKAGEDSLLPRGIYEFRTIDCGQGEGRLTVYVSSNKVARDCLLKNQALCSGMQPASGKLDPQTKPAHFTPPPPVPKQPNRMMLKLGASMKATKSKNASFWIPCMPACHFEIEIAPKAEAK